MVFQGLVFPFVFLLSMALVTLYYYLRIVVVFLVFSRPVIKGTLVFNDKAYVISLFVVLNFLGLAVSSAFILV